MSEQYRFAVSQLSAHLVDLAREQDKLYKVVLALDDAPDSVEAYSDVISALRLVSGTAALAGALAAVIQANIQADAVELDLTMAAEAREGNRLC
jgi:hypothetical protein